MHSPPPPPDGSADQLLHASADRLLVVVGRDATPELRKIFLRGSLAEARREVELGRRLHGLPVVECLAAELDPVTARPCVRMRRHDGKDLDALVAERGALPAVLACRIGASLAAALAALHAFRAADLPHGLVHGDVKPANVLWDGTAARLLDLEHCTPIGSGPAPLGSVGYQAPELADTAAAAAADLFACGHTLRFLLTGGDVRPRALAGADADLLELLAACTATAPLLRPTAAALATALAAAADRLAAEPLQAAADALLQGDFATAARSLDAAPATDPERRAELTARLQRTQRVLARAPQAATFATPATTPAQLLPQLAAVQAWLRHCPMHPAALRARAALRHAAAEAIADGLQHLGALDTEARYATAPAWLDAAIALAGRLLALPGGLRPAATGNPRLPSPLLQRPVQFLQQQQAALRTAAQEHQALLAEVDAAEANLDLAAAEAAIDRIGAQYGGTTTVTSQRRDRLHRLGFYLERISRAAPNVERLLELQPGVDVQPLLTFLAECLARSMRSPRAQEAAGGMGLRSLQISLANLADEFPALAARLQPAQASLRQALQGTTDHAWSLVEQAQQKLALQPVPVRPLQGLFHRLDGLRLLETFVDRPQRARTQLLDRIEALRLQLEQARATRDRLARGAEMALQKGHWTTGLFDMERAVQGLTDEAGSSEDVDVTRLRERLAAARRRKQEIEAAVRRNMDLGARYALLQDDPAATFGQRQQVLRERRDCLQFLTLNVPAERAALYARDLREVETQLALESALEAETQLDATEDPAERLALTRNTLAALEQSSGSDPGTGQPARVQRLLEHWRKLAATAQRQSDQAHVDRERARRRRRLQRTAAVAAVLLLLGTAAAFLPGVLAAGRDPAGLAALLRIDAVRVAGDPGRALADARIALDDPAAEPLFDVLRRAPTAVDPLAWHGELVAALTTSSLPPATAAQLWRIGLTAAAAHAPNHADALLAAAEAAAPTLRPRGVVLPRDTAAALQGLRR